jgi:hypothetical protein
LIEREDTKKERNLMKKTLSLLLILAILLMFSAAPALAAASIKAATIQSGTITDAKGGPISVGYDKWGYNYQAHMFNGAYADVDRTSGGLFQEVKLQMKWNDAWLANTDSDGDHKLDRHVGYPSYIGSGAWLTNHDSGTDEYGNTWTYFVKIVAVPTDATKIAGVWYAADGTEIGPDVWGEMAVVQQIITGSIPTEFAEYDLPFLGNYKSPAGTGLGNR